VDLSIVVPLYNEDESLPELEAWIRRVAEREDYDYEILFINDGSTDKSWQVVTQLAAQNDRVRGISFRRNYGKSAALQVGFEHARGEVVITMDADLQDSPDEIPALVKGIKVDGYDLVSGWKKKRYDPLTKTIPTKLFNAATRRLSGIKLHDFNCGLKAYRNTVVKSIEVYGEMHRYTPVLAKMAGYKNIGEQVVEHQARKYGTTKFGMERFINGFLDLLTIAFIGKFGKRPMHFFGAVGMFFVLVGLGILIFLACGKIFWEAAKIHDRPLFYLGNLSLIVGSQLFLTGFLAELITRNAGDRNKYLIENTIGLS